MGPYTEISLFAGYGGFSLGLRLAGLGIQTVCYVELDAYCQQIIQARIKDGYMDDAPIWDDVTTFDGRPWCGHVDLITGGFPCQPHSVAGRRQGADDERNLWPDTLRVIREVGPHCVLLENVPGILANGYGGTVVGQLSEAGYDCIWDCVSAAEVGAPHKRERWWCLAYAAGTGQPQPWVLSARSFQANGEGKVNFVGDGCQDVPYSVHDQPPIEQEPFARSNGSIVVGGDGQNGYVANSQEQGCPQPWGSIGTETTHPGLADPSWWAVEPDVGRVANGVASRVDRLRALGNGIVPAVVQELYRQRRG